MMKLRFALAVAIALSVGQQCAVAADAVRGKALYEARCDGCHDKSVHNRIARKARSYEEIRNMVERWSRQVGRGTWTGEEIDDVTRFLNERYYNLPCPPAACRDAQAMSIR
jgi:hypothetical protein